VLLTPRVQVHWLHVGRCRHPEWITLQGGRWGAVDFPSHCALIIHPSRGPVLYDTGYADHFNTETRTLPNALYRWTTPMCLPDDQHLSRQLAALGVAMDDVQQVLVSHLHADHVAGLRDLPRARFTALREDIADTLGRTGLGAVRRGFLPGLLPHDFRARVDLADDAGVIDLGPTWAPFDRGHDLFGDGSVIGIPLPGHSAAQLGVLIRNADGRPVMLVADACWSARAWQENRMPSPIARIVLHHWGRYRQTLSRIHDLGTRRPDLLILPSHCSHSGTGFRATHHAPA